MARKPTEARREAWNRVFLIALHCHILIFWNYEMVHLCLSLSVYDVLITAA
jgi:hypothetical protein